MSWPPKRNKIKNSQLQVKFTGPYKNSILEEHFKFVKKTFMSALPNAFAKSRKTPRTFMEGLPLKVLKTLWVIEIS